MHVQDTTWKRKAKREGWLSFVQSDADEIAARQGYYFDKAALVNKVVLESRFILNPQSGLETSR
jgi:hypothetical protein